MAAWSTSLPLGVRWQKARTSSAVTSALQVARLSDSRQMCGDYAYVGSARTETAPSSRMAVSARPGRARSE